MAEAQAWAVWAAWICSLFPLLPKSPAYAGLFYLCVRNVLALALTL